MPSEQLLIDLQAAGIVLPDYSIDLAVRVNKRGGASLPDETKTEDLYWWEKRDWSQNGVNWKDVMLSFSEVERKRILFAVGSIARAYSPHHELAFGNLREIREMTPGQLLDLTQVGIKHAGFVKIAFEQFPFEDEYTLTQMPSKKELEDFLRGMSGKPSVYGRRPVYNLETHRFER